MFLTNVYALVRAVPAPLKLVSAPTSLPKVTVTGHLAASLQQPLLCLLSSLYSPPGLLLLLSGPCSWKLLVPVKLLLPGFPMFPLPGIPQVSPSSSTLSVLSQQIEKLTTRGQEGKDNDSSELNVFFGHRHTWVVK